MTTRVAVRITEQEPVVITCWVAVTEQEPVRLRVGVMSLKEPPPRHMPHDVTVS